MSYNFPPGETVTYSTCNKFWSTGIEDKVIEAVSAKSNDILPLSRALLYAMHMKDQKESRLRLGLGIMVIYERRAG